MHDNTKLFVNYLFNSKADGPGNESEKLLRTLALQEIMNNNSDETFYKDMDSESVETFVAYIGRH